MADNIFQQLQELADYENRYDSTGFEEDRVLLTNLVSFFLGLDWQKSYTEWFAELRSLKPETLFEADGFMVDPDFPELDIPDDFKVDRIGFYKRGFCIFKGRFVYPVKDVRGMVAGLVGYDKFEEPKYLDSRTYTYISKNTTLYGMEYLPYYYRIKKIMVLEGVVDTLWLRENKFPATAALGSHLTPYVIQILKRFGRNCIIVPDSDEAGEHFKYQVKKELPEATILQTKLKKDMDDQRLISEEVCNQMLLDLNNFFANPFCTLETLMRT